MKNSYTNLHDQCYILTLGESIESLMEQATSHNSQCSSPSQLIQRAVVRCTKLIKNVEKGSFYDVHIGEWRTEPVHVKVYLERHKKFWFAESQIYQVNSAYLTIIMVVCELYNLIISNCIYTYNVTYFLSHD